MTANIWFQLYENVNFAPSTRELLITRELLNDEFRLKSGTYNK